MKTKLISAGLFIMSALFAMNAMANNPFVYTKYTSDPAPMVSSDGKLYVYTGHDEDASTWYTMNDWQVFSTEDLVNWTEYPSPLSYKTFTWSGGDAWAAQCCEKNGRYYWYVCAGNKSGQGGNMALGVAYASSPTAKFRAYSKILSNRYWGEIDPTVFIDDDGQAYLYWGNPQLYSAKLTANMLQLNGEPTKMPMTKEAFGGYKENDNIVGGDCYEEGPWLSKHGDTYYLLYAAGGVPEHIAYSTSSSPLGPWTYKGTIMPTQGGSFTNHCGIIEYKGHWYFFYHNGGLPRGGGFTRSVCVEEFQFNADGTIPTINMTTKGPNPIGTLDPYVRQEAETMAGCGNANNSNPSDLVIRSGVETNRGVYIKDLDDADYILVREVDFGEAGANSFKACIKSLGTPAQIRVKISGISSYVARINVDAELTDWTELEADLSRTVTGKHDVSFYVYTRKSSSKTQLLYFDWWQFSQEPVAIHDINTENASEKVAYYTLDGRKVATPGKGITIMRKADGTAVKVMNNR